MSARAHAGDEATEQHLDAARLTHARPRRDPRPADPDRRRTISVALGGGVLLIAAVVLSLMLGTVHLSPIQVLAAVFDPAGAEGQAAGVIWSIRLPRTLVAIIVGAALATVGTVMQALLRNPLADPGITGVSAGAAVGAVAGIVLGLASTAVWGISLAAFLGAAFVALILQAVLLVRPALGVTGIVLVGVSLSALGGALISLIIANAHDDALARGAMFWLAGDLELRTWSHVAMVALPALAGIAVLLLRSGPLDALSLGEDVAATSGVNVNRERLLLLLIASLVTGAAVAVSGIISFVGLIVPHAVRLVVGASHVRLLPIAATAGALFMVVADTVARTAFTPAVVQTGVVCAVVGAPVFLFLLLRRRAS